MADENLVFQGSFWHQIPHANTLSFPTHILLEFDLSNFIQTWFPHQPFAPHQVQPHISTILESTQIFHNMSAATTEEAKKKYYDLEKTPGGSETVEEGRARRASFYDSLSRRRQDAHHLTWANDLSGHQLMECKLIVDAAVSAQMRGCEATTEMMEGFFHQLFRTGTLQKRVLARNPPKRCYSKRRNPTRPIVPVQ